MELLFKSNPTVPAKSATLADTNFSDHYPTAHQSMAFKSIKPFIRQATRTYILRYLDQETYDDIAEKFNTNASMSASEMIFLEKLQDCIAYYTIYDAMPHLNVTLGDMGVQQSVSKDGTSQPSNQWSYKNLMWATLTKADILLDELLNWIEEEIKEGNDLFDAYKASDFYSKSISSLFKSPQDLQPYLDIKESRRTFAALIPYIEKAVKLHILPITCPDLLEAIKTQVKENTVSADNSKLLPYLRSVAAEKAAELALPHLALVLSDSGLRVLSDNDGMTFRNSAQSAEHNQAVLALKYQIESDGKRSKADLIRFLNDNADDYPLYKNSSCYSGAVGDPNQVICHGPGAVMF